MTYGSPQEEPPRRTAVQPNERASRDAQLAMDVVSGRQGRTVPETAGRLIEWASLHPRLSSPLLPFPSSLLLSPGLVWQL